MKPRNLFFSSVLGLLILGTTSVMPLPGQSVQAPAAAPAHAATSLPPTAEAANDIRDIRGPRAIASPDSWLLWIGGGLALAAVGYGAWRWYRRMVTAPRLPYEIALARLERARALMKIETARDFSIEVSEIVRSYIEARFHVQVAHQTTEEFLHDLLEPSDEMLAGHRELLGDFLSHCDLAKFARWNLSLEEMEEMHASARVFVSETAKASAPVSATSVSENQPVPA